MARKLKIEAAVLNIALHPHSPEIYANWLHAVYRKKLIRRIHGDRFAIISTLFKSDSEEGVLSGTIATFTKIDVDGEWFDSSELGTATNDVLSDINIPENLYPNYSTFYFCFDTISHKLYFQTYSHGRTLTPKPLHRFFTDAAQDIDISQAFGEAAVSIVQDQATLDRMLRLSVIKRVEIQISRPNTDIFDDDMQQKLEAHMGETGSKQITVAYDAVTGSSITATSEIKKIAGTALINGKVIVHGKDGNGTTTLSSDDFPQKLVGKYDPDVHGEQSAFIRLISSLFRRRANA